MVLATRAQPAMPQGPAPPSSPMLLKLDLKGRTSCPHGAYDHLTMVSSRVTNVGEKVKKNRKGEMFP